jgi:hypothetical protein
MVVVISVITHGPTVNECNGDFRQLRKQSVTHVALSQSSSLLGDDYAETDGSGTRGFKTDRCPFS